MLNKQKGNMYGWVTHTWNPIKGKCPHNCCYCYMKRFPQGDLRLDEKCLKDNLGEGNVIFVGSSTDMFASSVHNGWIEKVLEHCKKYPKNTYLFQSKDPRRFGRFLFKFPPKYMLGTTLESNQYWSHTSEAPSLIDRMQAMVNLPPEIDKMVSIEPIINFDPVMFKAWIVLIKPKFVSIGADSKNSGLEEPSENDIVELISELRKFTEVKIKDNLKRLVVIA